jgi:predicted Fe-Mo cluster-binding NifX family protein
MVPGFIHGKGAEVMISGGMGRRALAFFQDLGIQTATGGFGTVEETLTRYLSGDLTISEPCAESKRHEHHHHSHGDCGQDH